MPKSKWVALDTHTIEVEGVIISAQREGYDKNGNPRYKITRTWRHFDVILVARLTRMITSYNIQEDIKKYIAL